jgi:hypothetical protein
MKTKVKTLVVKKGYDAKDIAKSFAKLDEKTNDLVEDYPDFKITGIYEREICCFDSNSGDGKLLVRTIVYHKND